MVTAVPLTSSTPVAVPAAASTAVQSVHAIVSARAGAWTSEAARTVDAANRRIEKRIATTPCCYRRPAPRAGKFAFKAGRHIRDPILHNYCITCATDGTRWKIVYVQGVHGRVTALRRSRGIWGARSVKKADRCGGNLSERKRA